MSDVPPVLTEVTRYEVSVLPRNDINRPHFTIAVEYRGDNRWAVTRHRECLGADGAWGWEPSPSNREDDWVDAHRFDLDTALRLARDAAPHVVANGLAAVDAYYRTHPKETTR